LIWPQPTDEKDSISQHIPIFLTNDKFDLLLDMNMCSEQDFIDHKFIMDEYFIAKYSKEHNIWSVGYHWLLMYTQHWLCVHQQPIQENLISNKLKVINRSHNNGGVKLGSRGEGLGTVLPNKLMEEAWQRS